MRLSTVNLDEVEMIQEVTQTGRPRQRRRTRAAILKAAVDLLSSGRDPSMAEVAEAADVSRRTVYQHFPTLEQLLTEAALEAVRSVLDHLFDPPDRSEDVGERLDAMVRAVQRGTLANEPLLRTMIRLTVDRRADEKSNPTPRRGYRRVEWIETALAPIRARLGEARFERLVSALALSIGIEAVLVLRDIRGLSQTNAEDVSSWTARALLRATLEEVEHDSSG